MNRSGEGSARRTLGFALTAVGVVAMVAGWVRLRDTEILADQVAFLVSSGIGGVALVMAGITLIASAGTRAEVAGRLTRIESNIRATKGGRNP